MVPAHIFREYDIRGLADTELTDDVITKLGRAFATAMSRESKSKIAVGHDLRTSSPRLFKALTTGLMEGGMQIFNLGMIPTGLSYFSVSHFGYDASICITGSHNPPQYNGFKIHLKDRPFFGTEIQGLLEIIHKGSFHSGKGSIEKVDVVKVYEDYVLSLFKPKRKLKVVLDAGHGMGCMIAPDLIKKFGHQLSELYTNLDNTFPDHHPDPSEPHNLEDLQKKVLETKSDIGIAFDGDADRIGVVDEKGQVIPGDKILLLYARSILKRKPGAVVIGDVKCSKVVYDDITARGGKALMWKTGHSLIKAKMKETKAEMAGEMSGHMFFVDRWFGFDDAIYAACRMLEIMDEISGPLSAELAGLPPLVSTPEIRVDCPDEIKFKLVKDAVENFKKKYKVIDIDGARIEFADGWGLVRASNTQPVLVMRFEATSQKRLDEIRKIVEDEITALRGSH
jgi:phosphomannomutase / phosphoglucomutase